MCWTIRSLTKAHCFGFLPTRYLCTAPTGSFHQNLIWLDLLTAAQRSGRSKCARLSAPKKRAYCFRFFATKQICNAATTKNELFVDLLTLAQRSGRSRCAQLSVPSQTSAVSRFSQPSIYVMPRLVALTTKFFWSICSQRLRDMVAPSLLNDPLPNKGPLFEIFPNQAFL